MANKHGSAPNYMIQVKTVSGNAESGTQASYSNIRLIDSEENYFITEDEIVRCLCETLRKQSTPTSELDAESIMIATADEVKNIAITKLTVEK